MGKTSIWESLIVQTAPLTKIRSVILVICTVNLNYETKSEEICRKSHMILKIIICLMEQKIIFSIFKQARTHRPAMTLRNPFIFHM